MVPLHLSLSEKLKAFVDSQVAARGYATSSDYVSELIRRDEDREHLREMLLTGEASPPDRVADAAYFDAMRELAAAR
jgi:antitoxin ParD1/3/4